MIDVIDALHQQFTALPRKWVPAADLTDRDKLALAMAAGVEVDITTEVRGASYWLTMTAKRPFGVADRGDGGYVICIGPQPK